MISKYNLIYSAPSNTRRRMTVIYYDSSYGTTRNNPPSLRLSPNWMITASHAPWPVGRREYGSSATTLFSRILLPIMQDGQDFRRFRQAIDSDVIGIHRRYLGTDHAPGATDIRYAGNCSAVCSIAAHNRSAAGRLELRCHVQ